MKGDKHATSTILNHGDCSRYEFKNTTGMDVSMYYHKSEKFNESVGMQRQAYQYVEIVGQSQYRMQNEWTDCDDW